MLNQQERLLSDNANLRQHLLQMRSGSDASAQLLLLPQQEPTRPRLRQALLHAFGFSPSQEP